MTLYLVTQVTQLKKLWGNFLFVLYFHFLFVLYFHFLFVLYFHSYSIGQPVTITRLSADYCTSWFSSIFRNYFLYIKSYCYYFRYSEKSKTKCIGITIETRPDYCLKRHLSDMLKYGCTRLEIGVQSVYEDVARDTNR